MRTFQVYLPRVPMLDIEAENEAEALEKYMARFGIIDSDHEPTIKEILLSACKVSDEEE